MARSKHLTRCFPLMLVLLSSSFLFLPVFGGTSTISVSTPSRTDQNAASSSSSKPWTLLSSSRRRIRTNLLSTRSHQQEEEDIALLVKAHPRPLLTKNDVVVGRRGGGGNEEGGAGGGVIRTSIQSFANIIQQSKHHLAAAAAARAISILGMYPLDTIKTRMQMGQSAFPSGSGIGDLFRGVQGSLLGQVPYGVLTFGSYEMYKQALMERFGGSDSENDNPKVKPVFLYALSAILGDVTGSFWLCPSEVVKQQMQGGMYSTTSQAIQSIYKKSGPLGFYQGYFGGLSRDVPFRVAQLTSYEITKTLYLKRKANRLGSEDVTLSPTDSAICGAIAGSFSAAITAPLDRIKTLLMTDAAKYGTNPFSVAKGIAVNEGLQGLFRGITPRVIYIAPSVMIFFTVYEQVQQRLVEKK